MDILPLPDRHPTSFAGLTSRSHPLPCPRPYPETFSLLEELVLAGGSRSEHGGSEADDVVGGHHEGFRGGIPSQGRPFTIQPRSEPVLSGFTSRFDQVLGRASIARVSTPPGLDSPSSQHQLQRQYWSYRVVPSRALMRTRAIHCNIGL